jgi:hypothetical protein
LVRVQRPGSPIPIKFDPPLSINKALDRRKWTFRQISTCIFACTCACVRITVLRLHSSLPAYHQPCNSAYATTITCRCTSSCTKPRRHAANGPFVSIILQQTCMDVALRPDLVLQFPTRLKRLSIVRTYTREHSCQKHHRHMRRRTPLPPCHPVPLSALSLTTQRSPLLVNGVRSRY